MLVRRVEVMLSLEKLKYRVNLLRIFSSSYLCNCRKSTKKFIQDVQNLEKLDKRKEIQRPALTKGKQLVNR